MDTGLWRIHIIVNWAFVTREGTLEGVGRNSVGLDSAMWTLRVSRVSRGRFEASIFYGFYLVSFMGSSEAWRWVYVIYILGDGGS